MKQNGNRTKYNKSVESIVAETNKNEKSNVVEYKSKKSCSNLHFFTMMLVQTTVLLLLIAVSCLQCQVNDDTVIVYSIFELLFVRGFCIFCFY